jgi:cell division protein ZapE
LKPADSLQKRYEQALIDGARTTDPAQLAVVQSLAALEICLKTPRPRSVMSRVLNAARGDRDPPCRGVYLWGPVGRGKTWLMDMFFAGLAAKQARRTHFQHLMRDVHAMLADLKRQERPVDSVAAMLAKGLRVYCIDEFMVQDIGDAMILSALLEGLLQRGVTLVLTSNTPPKRLYEGGLQRDRFLPAISLLSKELDVIELGAGVDYRLRELKATPNYLRSGQPESAAQMRGLFSRLTEGAPNEDADNLRIHDRVIPVLGLVGGLVWFDFSALCEGPRSAIDYIAIADQMHTVFVSDVPVFDGGNDDAARRFIALIDELYDRRINIVVSAVAEPQELYRGERLRKDFTRTASRLLEMRSKTYLAKKRLKASPEKIASATQIQTKPTTRAPVKGS